MKYHLDYFSIIWQMSTVPSSGLQPELQSEAPRHASRMDEQRSCFVPPSKTKANKGNQQKRKKNKWRVQLSVFLYVLTTHCILDFSKLCDKYYFLEAKTSFKALKT